jgi:hypothetical protein
MRLENKSLRNLIDCLADKDTLVKTFWEMEWSFFFTIAYKFNRNKKSCYRLMNALFNELQLNMVIQLNLNYSLPQNCLPTVQAITIILLFI